MNEPNDRQPVRVDHLQGASFVENQIQSQGFSPATARSTSGMSVASLVLGILSVLGTGIVIIPPLLAVIFGHIGVSACNHNPNLDGKGLGIAGLIMGWICLAGWIIFILFLGGIATLIAAFGALSQ